MEQWYPESERLVREITLLSPPHCGAVFSHGSFRRHQSGWKLVTVGTGLSGGGGTLNTCNPGGAPAADLPAS